RNALTSAIGVFARSSGIFKGEAHIVGNEQIQMSVAVVIYEAAAGPKPMLSAQQSGRPRDIGESSIPVVAVQNVLPERGAKDIVEAIVVVVPDADSTSPSERAQSCFFRNICKRSVAVVFVQPIRGAPGSAFQPSARQHKQVHPPIIIVINEGAAASSGLYDVLFDFWVTIDHWIVQNRDSSDVHKMGVEGTSGCCGSGQRPGGVCRNTLRS